MTYVGADIFSGSKSLESLGRNIKIEIGNQGDAKFMNFICQKYGPFDIVVDDGAHFTETIKASFDALFNVKFMNDRSTYIIEDLHAMNIPGYDKNYNREGDFYSYLGELARETSVYFDKNQSLGKVSKYIYEIRLYDSMAFIYFRRNKQKLTELKKGSVCLNPGYVNQHISE